MIVAKLAVLVCASVAAGAVNAVAGGGSLLSFPAAVAFGLSPMVANATNSIAQTPGSIASAFGYRRELARDRHVLAVLLPPAFVGGLLGSILLLVTPQKLFDAIVPLLVLFATLLLLYQNLRGRAAPAPGADQRWMLPQSTRVAVLLQLLVGIYGGYFGAGMGIMMLAILDRMGGADIHAMNGVKSVLGVAINATASVVFLVAGAIDYRAGLIMAAGTIVGGMLGAAGARRVKPVYVRWGVVAIGLTLSAALGWHTWVAQG
jgi:uncharacterized membrane protein YfcA